MNARAADSNIILFAICVVRNAVSDLEAVLFQALLIRVGTILRAAIRMVKAAFGRLAQCHSHVQRPDREILFHAVADSPADDATRVEIKDKYSQPSPVQM